MLSFSTPVAKLNRIGKTTAARLKKLGIVTAADLLWHLPSYHDDLSQITPISQVKINKKVTIKARVELIANRRSKVKKMNLTEGLVRDETGSIKVIWFNQPFLTKQIKVGDELYLSGRVDDEFYTLQLTNPLWEKVKEDTIHTARIVPVYPTTSGLTQKQLRFLIKQVLPLAKEVDDYLPNQIRHQYKLMHLSDALFNIHWPDNLTKLSEARRRLKFDELFRLQLVQIKSKFDLKSQRAPRIPFLESATKELVNSLPFQLTNDQRKAAWEILQDLDRSVPMNRLLQGDVGSGKTVVAAIACLNCALNDFQAVMLAPTEILAFQHWQTLNKTLANFNIPLALFTRSHKLTTTSDKKLTKKELLRQIKEGEVKIIIGTHALLQEEVFFSNLGLIVIDEQHRFGVEQRKQLKDKTSDLLPHFLSMTATPIPRTLALTVYGDLDISIIRQKPPGRKEIITQIITPDKRQQAYNFIRDRVKQGEQVFVICPLIEESDKLGVKAAVSEWERLQQEVFPEFKVGLVHGKIKAKDKQEIMAKFKNKEIDILVATAVVEVGVDIPDATIMVIEGAQRFGLAQLHQFRGRVGRSDKQSYCFLFTDQFDSKTISRLKAMEQTNDGLKLAEFDLNIRGMGDLYGVRQSGMPSFKIASFQDLDIIKQARQAAQQVINESPDLALYPLLKKYFDTKIKQIHLE